MPAPGISLVSCTIAAGEVLSSIADCAAGRPVRIYMPAQWEPAALSMMMSDDGTNWFDVFNSEGFEASMFCIPGSVVPVLGSWPLQQAQIKLRSGTRLKPVSQPIAATFTLAVQA